MPLLPSSLALLSTLPPPPSPSYERVVSVLSTLSTLQTVKEAIPFAKSLVKAGPSPPAPVPPSLDPVLAAAVVSLPLRAPLAKILSSPLAPSPSALSAVLSPLLAHPLPPGPASVEPPNAFGSFAGSATERANVIVATLLSLSNKADYLASLFLQLGDDGLLALASRVSAILSALPGDNDVDAGLHSELTPILLNALGILSTSLMAAPSSLWSSVLGDLASVSLHTLDTPNLPHDVYGVAAKVLAAVLARAVPDDNITGAIVSGLWPSLYAQTHPETELPFTWASLAPSAPLAALPFAEWPLQARTSLLAGLLSSVPPPALVAPGWTEAGILFDCIIPHTLQVVQGAFEAGVPHVSLSAFNVFLSALDLASGHPDVMASLTAHTLRSILTVVFSHFTHTLYSIQRKVRAVFSAVLSVLAAKSTANPEWGAEHADFLPDLVQQVLSMDWDQKGKAQSLELLLPHVGGDELLASDPDIPHELLARVHSHGVVTGVAAAFVSLAKSCTNPSVWQIPLLQALASGPSDFIERVSAKVLVPLLKADSSTLGGLRTCLGTSPSILASPSDVPLVSLVVASVARKVGLISFEDAIHPESGILSLDMLRSCLVHASDAVILEAFQFVCSVSKSSTHPTQLEYQLVLSTLPLVGGSGSFKFVAEIAAALKYMFVRNSSALAGSVRELASYASYACSEACTAPPESIASKLASDMVPSVQLHLSFLESLLSEVTSWFFPGSSHLRRFLAVQILDTLMTVWFVPDKSNKSKKTIMGRISMYVDQIKDVQSASVPGADPVVSAVAPLLPRLLSAVCSPQVLETLLAGITDQYGRNRDAIAVMLDTIPAYIYEMPQFADAYRALFVDVGTRAWARLSAASLRETSSGALLLAFLYRRVVLPLAWEGILPGDGSALGVLAAFVDQVDARVQIILDGSWETAVSEAPLQGPLAVLAEMLRAIRPDLGKWIKEQAGSGDAWAAILGRTRAICIRIIEIIVPIVATNAPEGTGIDAQAGVMESALDTEDVIESTVASRKNQTIMVTVWRSMKEASAALGLAAALAADTGLLSEADARETGSVFRSVMSRVRHRGAMDSVSTGLEIITQALLAQNGQAELTRLPCEWVDDAVVMIAQAEAETSVSRRSAGLPYMFIALLRSEFGGSIRPLLRRAVEGLLDVVERPLGESPSDMEVQSVVHAWNVLRVIFRESVFARAIAFALPRALQAVIEGFSSSLWSIRNVCTLTYSALLARAIGSHSDRGSLSAIRMDAMTFFSKFPSLQTFLRDQVEAGTRALEGESGPRVLDPRLYPALVILSHLIPPSLQESSDKLHALFVPLLGRCAELPIYMARTMGARALVSVVARPEVPGLVASLASRIGGANVPSNTEHGILLQISALVEFHDKDVLSPEVEQTILSVASNESAAPLARALAFSLISHTDDGVNAALTTLEATQEWTPTQSQVPGAPEMVRRAAKVLGTREVGFMLGHGAYEVQLEALDSLCDDPSKCGPKVVEAVFNLAVSDASYFDVRRRACMVLSVVAGEPDGADRLGGLDYMKLATTVADEPFVETQVAGLIVLGAMLGRILEGSGSASVDLGPFPGLVWDMSSPLAIEAQRGAALGALEHLGPDALNELVLSCGQQSALWRAIICLVVDDAEVLRVRAGHLVARLVGGSSRVPSNPITSLRAWVEDVTEKMAASGGPCLEKWSKLLWEMCSGSMPEFRLQSANDAEGSEAAAGGEEGWDGMFEEERPNEFVEVWMLAGIAADVLESNPEVARLGRALNVERVVGDGEALLTRLETRISSVSSEFGGVFNSDTIFGDVYVWGVTACITFSVCGGGGGEGVASRILAMLKCDSGSAGGSAGGSVGEEGIVQTPIAEVLSKLATPMNE